VLTAPHRNETNMLQIVT